MGVFFFIINIKYNCIKNTILICPVFEMNFNGGSTVGI